MLRGVTMHNNTLTVQEDSNNGELFLEFPDDMLETMNWKEGDTIVWTDNENGSFTLSIKKETITQLTLDKSTDRA